MHNNNEEKRTRRFLSYSQKLHPSELIRQAKLQQQLFNIVEGHSKLYARYCIDKDGEINSRNALWYLLRREKRRRRHSTSKVNRKLPPSSVGEMLSYTLLKSEAAEFIESPAIKSPQQIKLLKSDDLDSDTCLCLQQRCQGGAFPNSSCNLVKSPKVSPDDDIWAGRQLRENNDDCASHTNHWCCNDMDRFEDSSWEILSSSSSLSKSSSHFELVDLVLFDDICEKDTGLNDELESSETTTYTKSYADVVKTPRKHQPKVRNAEREKHTEISWRQIVPVTKSTAGPGKHTEMSLWQIVPVSKSTAGLLSNDTVTENAEHRFDNHPRNLSEKNAKKVSACEGCSYYSCSCSDDERCISLATDLGFSFDSRDVNHQDPYLSSCRCCFEGGEFDFFVHADECLVDTDGWSILITYMHHSSEFHSPRHLLWLVERSKKGALLAIGINEMDQQKKELNAKKAGGGKNKEDPLFPGGCSCSQTIMTVLILL